MGRPGPGIMSKGMKAEESDGKEREKHWRGRQEPGQCFFILRAMGSL